MDYHTSAAEYSSVQNRRLAEILLACVLFSLASCAVESDIADARSDDSSADSELSIGPQFWLYDVSEFERSNHDVVSRMGGRWISVQYEAKANTTPDPSVMRQEIIDAFVQDGWSHSPLPSTEYVLSEVFEKGPDDLYFTRDARGNEPEWWFFGNVIHLSSNGRILCSYCEVGW